MVPVLLMFIPAGQAVLCLWKATLPPWASPFFSLGFFCAHSSGSPSSGPFLEAGTQETGSGRIWPLLCPPGDLGHGDGQPHVFFYY